ncbi:MAG: hypothetical protein COV46_01305 [Deltaproteobacteria bacterium CG11_big_fil_rev_8_21_14_0_20_49_13]|nr:MAG: hypothetical protein COV46_01305 [Deltaproteobacteria bacterium CG11_big_fil_rev_8_21_14_0_20_49_13]
MRLHKYLLCLFLVAALCSACDDGSRSLVQPPIFTNPATKLSQLSGQDFTQLLLSEAVEMEPLVTTAGAQKESWLFGVRI